MEFALWIYLFSVMGGLKDTLIALGLIGCMVFIVALVAVIVEGALDNYGKYLKGWVVGLLALFFVATFLPSESTSNKILAAYAAQNVAQMEDVQDVGSKSLQAMNKMLDEYLQSE